MSMPSSEDNLEELPASATPSRPLGRGNSNTNWGRRTGGLGRPVAADPPDLSRYPTTPRYDLTTIADLVGVRTVTVWSWEQNLGIIVHDPAAEAATGLRYSERDLIILKWLRDQIVSGVDPMAAAQRLREAIVAAGGTPPPLPPVSRTPSRLVNGPTARTGEQEPYAAGARYMDPAMNPPSQPVPQGPTGARYMDPMMNPPSQPMPQGPTGARYMDPAMYPPSQPVSRLSRGPNDPPSQPISRVGATRHSPESVMPPHSVRPVQEGGQVVSQTWVGAMPTRDLRGMVQPLLQAFTLYDVSTASRILDDAFLSRSVETTCATLIVPVLRRIREVWVRKDTVQPEGLFALNMLRGRLFRLFDVLPENGNAPLTFVAAGPGESDELEALMLALFWRRIGLRVVFFGQGATGHGIVEAVRKQRPRVIALTVSTAAFAKLIGQVAHEVQRLDPHPHFCLVGEILERNSGLQRKAGGTFLGRDAGDATVHVRELLRPAR